MNYSEALEKLQSFGQQHLLHYWESLSESEQQQLLKQIVALDIPTFNLQKNLLKQQLKPLKNIKPIQDTVSEGTTDDYELGLQILADARVGCILIAGGQGTRLNLKGPKGLVEITPIRKKTLFQLFAEKVVAASKRAKAHLPLAIMTSPLNHEETVDFFKKNKNFGLLDEQLDFFTQEMLPFVSKEGNLFLESPSKIAQGPDGNGMSLRYFVNHKIWEKWKRKGVDYCTYILVDNPLADPFDPVLIGNHHRSQTDVTVKCIERIKADEKVGLIVKQDDKVIVVEYTEMPEAEKSAVDKKGKLLHRCANMSNFCLSMDFVWEAAKIPLPLHCNLKAAKNIDKEEKEENKAWKFETFIFDILPYAMHVRALLVKREMAFAPLKNASGDDSFESVQKALQHQAIAQFEKITGTTISGDHFFELGQEFYYPTPELKQKWKGKSLPASDYVEG